MKKRILINALVVSCFLLASCGNNVLEDNASLASVSVESVENELTKEEIVSIEEKETEETEKMEVKEEVVIPALRDTVPSKLGCRIGCAVTGSEIDDEKVWEIITTHFNAVTLGNELKPDAIFNYSTSKVPGTQTVSLNGEDIVVPNVNYQRAEKILNKILDWNVNNPDKEIKVRGHVLVWHSQTPEWFFHVDYDKNKDYVDKETMNKRLEWYIKEVLTHFTGEDSKYKDLFYGWDVVNEAIGDGTGALRTDAQNPNEKLSDDRHGSNSSWWHIYQNDEFIINAFKYANKYAPSSLELYYNDYNETDALKRNAICDLLTAIKEAEGEPGVGTRIDAMGMQGHYGMDNPTSTTMSTAMSAYCKVVGNVQITEMDISASSSYDGSKEAKDDENERLRKRYNILYYEMNVAQSEPSVNITGLTFWGTVDHYSWLQSRSNVGGGNTTGLPQMPLLFDENYEPKPCFYVFAK